jgi:hypothetical protein
VRSRSRAKLCTPPGTHGEQAMIIDRSRVAGDSAKDMPRKPPVRELLAAEVLMAQRCAEDIAHILIEFARVLMSRREANESAQET